MQSELIVAESGSVAPTTTAGGSKGLKTGAIGYATNIVIAVAGTAPAYSLAATLGFIVAVAGVGTHAPAVLIVSFVPILLVSLAYRYLNLADPDTGTTFAWTTRAFGPRLGWVNGWALITADVIVMASLAEIAGVYSFRLVGWTAAENSNLAVILAAVAWIALMTWICYRGIEISARVQQLLLSFEVLILAIFAVVALVKVYSAHPAGAMHVSGSWFNPFDLSFSSLIDAVLLGIFIYWGWDASCSVNEESKDPTNGPGKAAVLSTVLLLLIYVLVTTAAQAFGGTRPLVANQSDVLSHLGGAVFGSGILSKLLVFAVLTSASASTQTTILPSARTALSMAHWGAIPEVFGKVHPRFQTPKWATLGVGAVALVWTVGLLALNPDQNVLGDTISALGFAVCFYYGCTGLACGWYYRRQILTSARRLLLVGLLPFAGGMMMLGIGVKAYFYYDKPGNNYSHALLGIQTPVLVGIGGLILGAVLMLVSWPIMRAYFSRRSETADPAILNDAEV